MCINKFTHFRYFSLGVHVKVDLYLDLEMECNPWGENGPHYSL